jgi:hypothetical protein
MKSAGEHDNEKRLSFLAVSALLLRDTTNRRKCLQGILIGERARAGIETTVSQGRFSNRANGGGCECTRREREPAAGKGVAPVALALLLIFSAGEGWSQEGWGIETTAGVRHR